MAVVQFFTRFVRIILQKALVVGEELDEATRERMQLREWYLSQKMTQMLQELEQGTQQQSGFAALQQWQLWAVAGVLLLLLLLFGLCWWLRKRSHKTEEQKTNPCFAGDMGTKWAKRFRELDELFPMVEEFKWISQKCKGNYHATTEASHWYKQHLRRSGFP